MSNRLIEAGRQVLGLDKEILLSQPLRELASKYQTIYYRQAEFPVGAVFVDAKRDNWLLQWATPAEIWWKNIGIDVDSVYARLAFDSARLGDFKRAVSLLTLLPKGKFGLEMVVEATFGAMDRSGESWEKQGLWLNLVKEMGIVPGEMGEQEAKRFMEEVTMVRLMVAYHSRFA